MQVRAQAWITIAQSKFNFHRKKIHRLLSLALIAPIFTSVTAPLPAQALTVAASDSYCTQTVNQTSGISVTHSGTSCIVTFSAPSNTTTSTTWTVPSGANTVAVLIVGGGGSGGVRHGGGGGAGGYIYQTGVSLTVGASISISVGAGGASVSGAASNGIAGTASSFNGTTAVGGGFGGQTSNGGTGGSGGGSCCASAPGAGTSGQGNGGGYGTQSNIENGWSGGGGGGANGGGGSSTSTSAIDSTHWTAGTATGGTGGDGIANSISGSSVCYAAGGGGSGGNGDVSTGAGGAGGACNGVTSGGLGGKGSNGTSPNRLATQGADGTGSGGGGGGFAGGSNAASGRGGSGIVIVKYDMPTITFDANSGTGSASYTSQSVNTSGQVTLPTKNTLARTGYVFGGWNTAADGSGTNYAESAVVTPTSSYTLYARWYPIATFNGNGYVTDASTVPAAQAITATTATNSLPIPYSLRKNTYRFGGWNTNETGTGTNTSGSNVDIYDLKEPYLRLEAQNYNTSTNTWVATNGTSVPSSKIKSGANITKVTNTAASGFAGTETFTAIRGTAAAGIALGNASLTNGFTFCTVARATNTQTAGANNGGRIFDGVSGNFLIGWWAGYQASFYHEGWMNNSTTARNTNFHVVCDRPASNRFDGTQVSTTGSGTTTLPEMSINNGNFTDGSTIRAAGGTPANTSETTPWEVAEIIIYDRTLSDADLLKVESYLKYRYGVTAATNGSYTVGSASATYQTAAPQTLYAQWNSVIVYDANGGTGTAPANTTITGTGGALASNTGSLANGANAFLGWYTNSSGTGGSFYAAGATYPNSGSKTLYAVYGPALAIGGGSTATFANGTGGRSETYTVSGGVGTRIVSNAVTPTNAGITLDSSTANSLVINVSSTVAPGTYYDTMTVRDDGFTVTKTITITVVSPLVWSASNPTTVVTTYGKPTRTRLDLSGGTGTRIATLTQMSTPAPRFVTLDTSTIASGYITLITDTVTVAGTYVESITVVDATNVKKTALVTITINSPPDITYTTATDAEYPLLSTDLFLNYDLSNLSSYPGTGTSITDLKGNALSGTITSASMYSSGNSGSLSLNGTNRVVIQHTPFTTSQSFSKFLWIYPTSSTGSIIDVCDNTSCNSYHESELELSGGVLYAAAYLTGTVNSGSTTVSLNQWHYVGFTWEYSSSTLSYTKLYIDGKLVGSSTNSGTRYTPATEYNLLSVGDTTKLATSANGTFLLGAYHVYKAAITPNQVMANYANTKTRFLSLSPAAPTVSGNATFTMTEGKSATYQIFAETGGSGANSFSLSGTNSAISLASVGTDQTSVVVSSSITATNATTAKTYYETLTATDSVSAATAYYLTIVVNPKISISTTTDTVTTTFGKIAYDTITASYGTGALTFSRVSSSGSSAITSPVTGSQALLTIAGTLPVGTYYETFTVTDSLGATTVKVILITVNPALTLTSATGVNQIETTYTKAASLTINVANGTGTRTASALPVTVSGVSLTTTNLQNGTLVLALNTAVAVGTYVETITVSDSVSASTSLVITIIVNASPSISYGGATSGTVTFVTTQGGSLQSGAFTAAYGTGSKSLALSGTNAAISIDTSQTNVAVLTFGSSLTSTDSATSKSHYETITVTDSLGATSTRSITVLVNPPIIETSAATSLATTSGIETTTVIYATKGSSDKTFALSGTALSGVTLTSGINQATLRVLSTINPGTYFETITASDTSGATSTIMITIVVSPPPSMVGSSRIESTQGVYFKSPIYSISGGTGTLSMSVTNSPTNANITLTGVTSSGGYLQIGTGSATGTFISTIRVTDAKGSYSEIAVTVVVNAPVTLTGSLSISKTYGTATTNGYSTNGTGTAPFAFSSTPVCAVVKTVSGSYTYEKINGTDSCTWTAPVGVSAIDALLVGAGGGGGGDGGSGGGGGSINTLSSVSLPANRQLSVQVGSGGTGGVWGGSAATSGGTTSLVSGSTTYTAPGGSAGGGCGSAASAGGVTGSGGSPTAGGASGYGSSGACSAGSGGVGSAGPSSSFTGSAVNYGGGGGGGPFPSTTSSVGGNAGGAGGGGTSAISKSYASYGLTTYFKLGNSTTINGTGTPTTGNATLKTAITAGEACAVVTGNINYTTDTDFPCTTQTDYFQGYATGYFIAPFTGDITFYTASDDSSDLTITVGSTVNELKLADCCRTASATFTGFVQGQAYPISAYFTEIAGGANWTISYSYTGQSQKIIPISQFRSTAEGLAQYFEYVGTTPASATNKTVISASSSSCREVVGIINYATDSAFPCTSSQLDNFRGYATGYFVAPYTGDITFYLDSDDSSDLQINVNGTTRELQLSIGSTSATYSGFVQGQYYPINVYFTEITGAAVWKLSYSYGSQAKIAIPSAYLRSTADFTAPTAGTNGYGGGGGAGAAGLFKVNGASGGSGTVIIKYLTQSDTSTETMITAVVETSTPTGLLTLNVPAYVTVGTYTETIKVLDAANSPPYSATVTITISKATPTATLSLPGGVTTAKYGTPVILSVTASTPGNVAFKKAGSAITGCSSVATSSGVATCTWTPTVVETASISALLSPTDSTNYNNSVETASASTLSIVVGKADTLTITANSPNAITYSAGMTIPTNGFTTSGLKSIDTITAVSYAYTYTPTTCAAGGSCAVGDIGPAGGRVIYVSATTIDTATGISAGGIYLEAAPAPYSTTTYNWCEGGANPYTTTINATGSAVGTGADNTRIMVANCTGGAGYVAANLTLNGFSDWFLPSSGELSLLAAYKTQIGLDNNSLYWGSTEASNWVAASLVTWNNGVGGQNKGQATPLWPIRAFSPTGVVTGTPVNAGVYTITPSSAIFTSGAASNYISVQYVAGSLTINRAGRSTWSASYASGTNITRYGSGKTETATVSFSGDGSATFSTSSTTCSVSAVTGTITTLGVGSCAVAAVLPQTQNWNSDTKTVTVTINRGLRTATISPALTTIKYGDTTTANSTISPALDSATVTYSNNSTLGCSIDNITGLVTGVKALATCNISVRYEQTSLYESATASASITVNKATAPVVTTDSITAVSYTGSMAIVTPTYKVTGILARDIAQILPAVDVSSSAAIAAITPTRYSTVASFLYFATNQTSYSSTTAPTLGGTYSVTPQTLTLLNGVDIGNYENPTYVSSNLVINPIAQTKVSIQLSYMDTVTVPYDVPITGGSSSVSPTLAIISGGTAQGCAVDSAVSAMRLKTTSPGTCIIQVTKPADRNYLIAVSDTQTVNILNFVVNLLQIFDNPTGIAINHDVPFTKGADVCTSNCQPTISDIQDTSGTSITSLRAGQTIWIIGTNFTTATAVYFKRSTPADAFQIDSDTKIIATIPSTIQPNAGETSSSITISISVVASGGRSFPNSQIVTVTL